MTCPSDSFRRTAILLLFFVALPAGFTFGQQSLRDSLQYYLYKSRQMGDAEQWKEALAFSDSALILAKASHQTDSLVTLHNLRSAWFEERRDYRKSLQEARLWQKLLDSINVLNNKKLNDSIALMIYSVSESGRVEAIRLKEELNKREEQHAAETRQLVFGVAGLLLLVTIGVVTFYRRQREEVNRLSMVREDLSQSKAFIERLFILLSRDLGKLRSQLDVLPAPAAQTTKANLDRVIQWVSLQAGAMPFHPEVLEAGEFINKGLKEFEKEMKDKSIRVDIMIPSGFTIYADEEMLRLVFKNLISNSLQSLTSNGAITLFAGKKDGLAMLGVQDNGRGIPQEATAVLFEQSSDSGLEYHGEGLGLILCREVIKRHGGTLSFESTEGQGSKFYFTLPDQK